MEVSPFALGTMMLGSVGNPDHEECVRIVRTALESGINFVDTADMYSAGESEVIVGKALASCRDDVILATKSHRVSQARGLMRFRSEQPPYNLLARGIERDVLPVAERWGMGVLTWSPLAFGFLTGRYRKGAETPTNGRAALRPQWFDPADPVTARKLDVVEQLVAVANAAGCALPALATAFPLAHRAVTSVIIGPRTLEQAESTLTTMDLRLGDDILDRIDEIVPPGTEIYSPQDASLELPWLTDANLRRRTATGGRS